MYHFLPNINLKYKLSKVVIYLFFLLFILCWRTADLSPLSESTNSALIQLKLFT